MQNKLVELDVKSNVKFYKFSVLEFFSINPRSSKFLIYKPIIPKHKPPLIPLPRLLIHCNLQNPPTKLQPNIDQIIH